MINVVASASKSKIHIVVMGGGSVDLEAASNEKVGSILWAYPGQSGGVAIANTLTGSNVPSGRLTQTFYPASFVNEVSMFDMNMRPNPSTGNPGRSYRFYTGTPVYKFGDGLSYNTFNYSMASKNEQTILKGAVVDTIGDKYHNDLIAAKQQILVEIPITVQNLARSAVLPKLFWSTFTHLKMHSNRDFNQISAMVRASSLYDRGRCYKVANCPEGE